MKKSYLWLIVILIVLIAVLAFAFRSKLRLSPDAGGLCPNTCEVGSITHTKSGGTYTAQSVTGNINRVRTTFRKGDIFNCGIGPECGPCPIPSTVTENLRTYTINIINDGCLT